MDIKIGAYQGRPGGIDKDVNLGYVDREAHRRFIERLIGADELKRIDEKAEAESAMLNK